MGEARHSVMLLGEEFGVHIPRALATFIAGLGPIGAALEAAFPFLAIAVGATLLIEHLVKMQEAGQKLTEDQVKFGTAAQNAFNALDQKLIQAQIKSDELRNNHLGALQLQLELIDKQSMAELIHSFEEVAKGADAVMKGLEGHWYTFGAGSDGAKHALEDFHTQYASLLALGKKDEASGLLKGTLDQAVKVRDALKTYHDNSGTLLGAPKEGADTGAALRAFQVLHAVKLSGTEAELSAQEQLVDTLQKQVGIEECLAALNKLDKGNTTKTEGNAAAAQSAAAARQAAESQLRMGEQSIAADRATADAQLAITRASLEERLASDLDFAGRDRDVKEAANQAEIAALDKSGKDYQNQLRALQDKALEINSEYDTKVVELKAKSSEETANRDISTLEQAERGKIEATRQGSEARLSVIDAAITEEQSHNLQDTNFFRELLNMRVDTARREAEDEGKLRAEAAREDADNTEKLGTLAIQAEKQRMALEDSARRVTIEQRIAEDTKVANEEFALKMAAWSKEYDGLDKSGKDYENKLKQLQDKEKQLIQQHENEITGIKEKAEIESNNRIFAGWQQFSSQMASGLSQSIMGHQTWAKMVNSLGDQVVSGMIQNAIKSMMVADMDKEKQAAKAARAAFNIGMSIGGPAGIVLGPVFGAAAFAAEMAFENGTDRVPGVGYGDIVPAMLSPGEGIVPGGVMDGLRNVARSGGFDQRPSMTVHVRPTYNVQTIDGDGMRAALEKNTDQLQRHFENTIRRLNR
jgi:hypothetical protein